MYTHIHSPQTRLKNELSIFIKRKHDKAKSNSVFNIRHVDRQVALGKYIEKGRNSDSEMLKIKKRRFQTHEKIWT